MLTERQLGWLAGIWDGEGSITVFKYAEKNGAIKYCPTICAVNTDLTIINEVQKLADLLGINFHLMERKIPKSKRDKHSISYQLITRKMSYIKKFLEIITPYLISKKAQAELVLRFVNKRLAKLEINKGSNAKSRYSEDEIEISKNIRELNKRGPNSPTTTSSTL